MSWRVYHSPHLICFLWFCSLYLMLTLAAGLLSMGYVIILPLAVLCIFAKNYELHYPENGF